jgi:nicotinamide riboside kinase
MTVLKIALTGAPNTGKSQLAAALNRALQASEENAFVVVANTPALLAGLARNDLTLLMGLQTPEKSQFPTGTQEAEDLFIRAALAHAAVPYRVIYGTGEERLAQALHAARRLLPRTEKLLRPNSYANTPKTSAWVWICDKCSDSQCEHRLLTALLAQRASTA